MLDLHCTFAPYKQSEAEVISCLWLTTQPLHYLSNISGLKRHFNKDFFLQNKEILLFSAINLYSFPARSCISARALPQLPLPAHMFACSVWHDHWSAACAADWRFRCSKCLQLSLHLLYSCCCCAHFWLFVLLFSVWNCFKAIAITADPAACCLCCQPACSVNCDL